MASFPRRGFQPPSTTALPLLILLLLPAVAESLSTTGGSMASPAALAAAADNDRRRVFVGNLDPSAATARSLRDAFARHGAVSDVTVHGLDDGPAGRTRRPFAFVTYDSPESAASALAAPPPPATRDGDGRQVRPLYGTVQRATPPDPARRRRGNAARAREAEAVASANEWARRTDLVVQAQTTHVDRLVGHIDGRVGGAEVVGVTGARNNCSLVMVSCPSDRTGVARGLYADVTLRRAVNKTYPVFRGRAVQSDLSTEGGRLEFLRSTFLSEGESIGGSPCRMQIYPPRHTIALAEAAEGEGLAVNPKRFDTMLSAVEVHRHGGRGSDGIGGLYMWGVTEADPERDVVDMNLVDEDGGGGGGGDEVCRAYYKLREAVEAYEAAHGGDGLGGLRGCVGLDAGSAPGGWTRYLLERFECSVVHSVDPAELDPSVLGMEGTRHMRMKVQDALPALLAEAGGGDGGPGVRIWVSDMCLHAMEEQVRFLLDARDAGVLSGVGPTLFVLTLKCVLGHSRAAYDEQVAKVVEDMRARADVRDVEVYHLFSNRSGERTVIGWLW